MIKQDCTDQAIPILKSLAPTAHFYAIRWADKLAEQGRTDEAVEVLRAGDDVYSQSTAKEVVEILKANHRTADAIDFLRNRTDGGDKDASSRLAEMLAEQGDIDELRVRADTGDRSAAWGLPMF